MQVASSQELNNKKVNWQRHKMIKAKSKKYKIEK